MTYTELEEYLLALPGAWRDTPFGEGKSVYKVGDVSHHEAKLFAVIDDNSQPLRVSLKCDPQLVENLRQKYESVLPGHQLNKKYWNTIICSGQLTDQEVKDLALLSYRLVSEEQTLVEDSVS